MFKQHFARYAVWWTPARIIGAGGLLLWLAINLLTLLRYPLLTCDEAFYSMAGDRLVGALLGVHRPVLLPTYYPALLPYGRINLLGIGLYGLLFGQGPLSARLWGLTGWLVSIVSTYWAAKKLGLNRLAIWPAALMAVAWLPLFYGHNGRPHIWVSAIGALSLGLLIQALSDSKPSRLMAVTAFPALMLDFHLNSFHFLVANTLIAVCVLIQRREARKIGWLVLGGIIVMPFLVGARFIPDPDAMLHALRGGNPFSALEVYAVAGPSNVTDGIVLKLFTRLLDFVSWWIASYVHPPLFEGLPQALLLLFGIATAWFSQKSHHRLLAAYYLVASLSFAELVTFKWQTYAAPWMPLLLLLATAGMQWFQEVVWPRLTDRLAHWKGQVGPGMLGLLLILYLVGDVYVMRQPRNDRFFSVAHRLSELIPDGASVLTEVTWWFALPNSAIIDEHLAVVGLQPIPYYQLNSLGPEAFIRQNVLERLKPDYVLTDDLIGCVDSVNPIGLALTAVVKNKCTLIESALVDRPDGTVRQTNLYHCDRSNSH